MDFKDIFLTTFVPEWPRIYKYNNDVLKRYLDVIYNEQTGVLIAPVNTPGKVKASSGEFVTCVTDNLIVKKQWVNSYENVTNIDQDYYNTYIGSDVSSLTRDPSVIGTQENRLFRYVDVLKPYYKIRNDVSTAFKCTQLGQEIQILFNTSTGSLAPYSILYDPCINGRFRTIKINHVDVSSGATWLKLIATEYDASYGTTWAVKQYGGTITIS